MTLKNTIYLGVYKDAKPGRKHGQTKGQGGQRQQQRQQSNDESDVLSQMPGTGSSKRHKAEVMRGALLPSSAASIL